VAVVAASPLLNAAYFAPIVYRAFFLPEARETAPHGEAPASMVIALCASAAATLWLFFFPEVPLALARALGEG
jgi:multicomponent Na+:H+ antiporter subunit D